MPPSEPVEPLHADEFALMRALLERLAARVPTVPLRLACELLIDWIDGQLSRIRSGGKS